MAAEADAEGLAVVVAAAVWLADKVAAGSALVAAVAGSAVAAAASQAA